MSKQYKTYVGADLHKTFTHFTAQDRTGKEKACESTSCVPEAPSRIRLRRRRIRA